MSLPGDPDEPPLEVGPARKVRGAGPPSPASRFRRVEAPRFLQLELVGRCNLRCGLCPSRFRATEAGSGLMDWTLLTRVMAQLPRLERLRLDGLGEPMLHPRFFDAVAFAAARGVQVAAATNATLIDGVCAERLVRSGLETLEASIDGATRETFEALRPPARFSTVLRGLTLLRRVKERLSAARPAVSVAVLAARENLPELAALVRLARRLGVARVLVRRPSHDFSERALPEEYRPMRDIIRSQSLAYEDAERVERHFSRARQAADECGVELRLPDAAPASPCRRPWQGLYLSWDGLAMPCEVAGTPERSCVGDARPRFLGALWNGEDLGDFREALESDAPPELCRGCVFYKR
ncbi:MAG: radical SAM protein [Elusimicrobia bacterium]|nr:radical SAM protein [Elusimicrobiota bacterium]